MKTEKEIVFDLSCTLFATYVFVEQTYGDKFIFSESAYKGDVPAYRGALKLHLLDLPNTLIIWTLIRVPEFRGGHAGMLLKTPVER